MKQTYTFYTKFNPEEKNSIIENRNFSITYIPKPTGFTADKFSFLKSQCFICIISPNTGRHLDLLFYKL